MITKPMAKPADQSILLPGLYMSKDEGLIVVRLTETKSCFTLTLDMHETAAVFIRRYEKRHGYCPFSHEEAKKGAWLLFSYKGIFNKDGKMIVKKSGSIHALTPWKKTNFFLYPYRNGLMLEFEKID